MSVTGSMTISLPDAGEKRLDDRHAVFGRDQRHSGAARSAPEPGDFRSNDLRPVRCALRGRRPDRARDGDLPTPISGRLPAPEQIFRQGVASHHVAAGGVDDDWRCDRRWYKKNYLKA